MKHNPRFNNSSRPSRHARQYDEVRPALPFKKKVFGQHFLRKQSAVDHMIEAVSVTPETTVLEIGCGDGFLTKSILAQTPCKELWCFEIDPEWAAVVRGAVPDPRLTIHLQNVLEADFGALEPRKPWVMLANLPYNITFPIIFQIQRHKHLFTEGVIMVQDEVARKIVATEGRTYNPTSLFLQHHFSWKLMEKIEPGAFTPPPKVNSRLLHFVPKVDIAPIPQEEAFWKFIKFCFRSPRQTIKNNLKPTHYNNHPAITPDILALRAQQMSFADFLRVWELITL